MQLGEVEEHDVEVAEGRRYKSTKAREGVDMDNKFKVFKGGGIGRVDYTGLYFQLFTLLGGIHNRCESGAYGSTAEPV